MFINKNSHLNIIFIIYAILMIMIFLYYKRKFKLLKEKLNNNLITKELYEKKKQSILWQYRLWYFILPLTAFLLMIA